VERMELHQSDLLLLETCGEAYRRRVIERQFRPSNVRMMVGTAVHAGREVNLAQKVTSGKDLEETAVTEAARDRVVEGFAEDQVELESEFDGLPKRAVRDQAVDTAVSLARLDYHHFQEPMRPTAVEASIAVRLQNYPFDIGMRLDVIEELPDGGTAVRDAKTSKRTPAKTVAETSEQLALYSLGARAFCQRPIAEASLDYLVALKSGPKAVRFATVVSEQDERAILQRLAMAYEATAKGVFVPASQGHWKCSETWCEYWRDCPYVIGRRRPEN